MVQAPLHPLPPDVLDEPETIDLRSADEVQGETLPPTTPTIPPN